MNLCIAKRMGWDVLKTLGIFLATYTVFTALGYFYVNVCGLEATHVKPATIVTYFANGLLMTVLGVLLLFIAALFVVGVVAFFKQWYDESKAACAPKKKKKRRK